MAIGDYEREKIKREKMMIYDGDETMMKKTMDREPNPAEVLEKYLNDRFNEAEERICDLTIELKTWNTIRELSRGGLSSIEENKPF